MIWIYKILKDDNTSVGKKYCITLDYRQRS